MLVAGLAFVAAALWWMFDAALSGRMARVHPRWVASRRNRIKMNRPSARIVNARGSGQHAPDRRGIHALCGIEAVTHQPEMILPCSDPAFAGVDQRQLQIGRIERKAREHAGDTAARRHHKGRRGMGELIVLAVIDRSKSEGPGQFRNVLRRAAQEECVLGKASRGAESGHSFIAAASAALSLGSRPATISRKSVPGRSPLCSSASDTMLMIGPHRVLQV